MKMNRKAEEQKLQSKVSKYLIERGWYVVKVIMSSRAGVADLHCCCCGLYVGIELKDEVFGKSSDLQEYNKYKTEKSGGFYFRVRTLDEAKKAVATVESFVSTLNIRKDCLRK